MRRNSHLETRGCLAGAAARSAALPPYYEDDLELDLHNLVLLLDAATLAHDGIPFVVNGKRVEALDRLMAMIHVARDCSRLMYLRSTGTWP